MREKRLDVVSGSICSFHRVQEDNLTQEMCRVATQRRLSQIIGVPVRTICFASCNRRPLPMSAILQMVSTPLLHPSTTNASDQHWSPAGTAEGRYFSPEVTPSLAPMAPGRGYITSICSSRPTSPPSALRTIISPFSPPPPQQCQLVPFLDRMTGMLFSSTMPYTVTVFLCPLGKGRGGVKSLAFIVGWTGKALSDCAFLPGVRNPLDRGISRYCARQS